MKPPPFEYDCPGTLAEAVDLLAKYGDEAKVLAGGQSLVPLMNFRLARPSRLIDINRIPELNFISVADGSMRIGATTRHLEVETSEAVRSYAPILAEAVSFVGHLQIRNRGTVGGSVAHADPAAELPCVFAALDAAFHVRSSRGDRRIPWHDFFRAEFTTALEPDEMLCWVEFAIPPAETRSAFVEFSRRQGDFALAGAAVIVIPNDEGAWADVRIALLSAGSAPMRAVAAEAMLLSSRPDIVAIQSAARESIREVQAPSDIHASSAYRSHLLRVLTERALLGVASAQ